jgi:putative resolvase
MASKIIQNNTCKKCNSIYTKWLTGSEMQELYHVSQETLRRWVRENRIECLRTEGGHRRYKTPIKPLSEVWDTDKPYSFIYISARSENEQEFLDTQRSLKTTKFKYKGKEILPYKSYIILQDIVLDDNATRPNLHEIIKHVMSGTVNEIVIYSRDIISDFALIEMICEFHETTLTVHNTEM